MYRKVAKRQTERNFLVWAAESRSAADLLCLIYPYLTGSKRRQAAIGIEFQAILEANRGRPYRLSVEQVDYREQMSLTLVQEKRNIYE